MSSLESILYREGISAYPLKRVVAKIHVDKIYLWMDYELLVDCAMLLKYLYHKWINHTLTR